MNKQTKNIVTYGLVGLGLYGAYRFFKGPGAKARTVTPPVPQSDAFSDSVKTYTPPTDAQTLADKVRKFQALVGILADGVVGPITLGKAKELGFNSIALSNIDGLINAAQKKQTSAANIVSLAAAQSAKVLNAKNIAELFAKGGFMYTAFGTANLYSVSLSADGKNYIRTGTTITISNNKKFDRDVLFPAGTKYTSSGWLVVSYNGNLWLTDPNFWAVIK